MAEASRFPKLALPFAIVGAAGGWLSAGLMSNPLVQRAKSSPQLLATLLAAGFAALTGALLTRWCTNDEAYRFHSSELGPDGRPPSDTWPRHALAVLAAGTITGALVAGVSRAYNGMAIGALGGMLSALAFVPVCLAVVAAARRAMRARLGSIVASSDRRAVWGILAMALTIATLEALPQWAAAAAGDVPSAAPVKYMVGLAGLAIAFILLADLAALRRARAALSLDLVQRSAEQVDAADTRAPRLDLGLGDDIAAQVAAPANAYRGRERTVALITGSPEQAMVALRGAARRGIAGLVLVALVGGAHAFAAGDSARLVFDESRCESLDTLACARAAGALRRTSPLRAKHLYERACSTLSVESCIAAGEMYDEEADARGEQNDARNFGLPHENRDVAMKYFARACDYGDRRACFRMTY